MKRFTLLSVSGDGSLTIRTCANGGTPSVHVRAGGRIETDAEGTLRTVLPEGLEATGPVLLDLPPSQVLRRVLPMPIRDASKVRELLPMEAEGRFQAPVPELALEYLDLPGTDTGGDAPAEMLLLATPKTKLAGLLDALAEGGLDPKIVTCLPLRNLTDGETTPVEEIMEPPALDEATELRLAGRELRQPRLNFRQGDLRYTAHQKEAVRVLRLTVPLLVILAVLLAANWGVRYRHLSSRVSAATERQAEIFRSAFPKGSKQVDASLQVRTRTRELTEKLEVLSGLAALDRLESISELADAAGAIDLTEARLDENTVVLKGSGDSFGTMNAFAESLKKIFSSVEISDSTADTAGGVRFTLVLKGGGEPT